MSVQLSPFNCTVTGNPVSFQLSQRYDLFYALWRILTNYSVTRLHQWLVVCRTANYCTFGKRDTNTIWAVTLAGRICAVVGDLLVLFVTWFQTYASYRGQQGALEGPSLTRAMLYNGAYLNISQLASAHGVDIQGAHISCESSS